MTARVSAAQRLKMAGRAEVEIMRYADDHALWHKHVHGATLDSMQILKCIEMDQNRNTIDFSCRRTRKTSIKELYALKWLATHPHEDEGIVAPRMQQALTNLNYHTEAIRRSPILSAYLATKNGRRQMTDSGYQFANGSGAAAYGIMSQIDGDSITIASLEEVDDMPHDRLMSRFLPMLGATERLALNKKLEPQIRVTGVFKGADALTSLIKSGNYHVLPTVNVYMGIQLGIISEPWAMQMRADNSEGEWVRQFLCKNLSAQNWIWEKHIRRALQVGVKAGLEVAEPLPGVRYGRRGLLSFGYDHSGHGESPTASRSALVVAEQIGNFVTFPFVKTWPAGTDDAVVERDLYGLWDYFRPDFAIGDAYGLGMLTNLNDRLFAAGLVDVDRRTVGEGQSTGSTWPGWPFSPMRFEGATKFSMASVLKGAFHNGQAAIPWFDDEAQDALSRDLHTFVRQLGNMKAEATKAAYSSFQMVEKKLGDDLFDAAMAAVWALVTRGLADAPALVGRSVVSREALLSGVRSLPGAVEMTQARAQAWAQWLMWWHWMQRMGGQHGR